MIWSKIFHSLSLRFLLVKLKVYSMVKPLQAPRGYKTGLLHNCLFKSANCGYRINSDWSFISKHILQVSFNAAPLHCFTRILNMIFLLHFPPFMFSDTFFIQIKKIIIFIFTNKYKKLFIYNIFTSNHWGPFYLLV
jgi:hypothetical protein